MIDYVQAYKPLYRVKDILNPPYPIYYAISADFHELNEKGYWAVYIIPQDRFTEDCEQEKRWIKVYQDDLCNEEDALVLINQLRHNTNKQSEEKKSLPGSEV